MNVTSTLKPGRAKSSGEVALQKQHSRATRASSSALGAPFARSTRGITLIYARQVLYDDSLNHPLLTAKSNFIVYFRPIPAFQLLRKFDQRT